MCEGGRTFLSCLDNFEIWGEEVVSQFNQYKQGREEMFKNFEATLILS